MDRRDALTALEVALTALIALAFFAGGSSHGLPWGGVMAQLASLPAIVVAGYVLSGRPTAGLRRWCMALALLVVAFPAVQLLTVPDALWTSSRGRLELLADLRAAGVEPRRTWSLAPAMTERALWSQLPALAAFLGVLALDASRRRRLARHVLIFITASLLLGVVHRVVGAGSVLDAFGEWLPVVRGVFANPNHHGTALVIGAVLGLALWLQGRRGGDGGRSVDAWGGLACAAACVISLPATGSRAGMLLLGLAVPGLLLASHGLPGRRWCRWTRVGWRTATVAAFAVCATLALGLLAETVERDARWPMATATATLAHDAWPLGIGVGAFRAWFEQQGPDALLGLEYINHAHNEYVQWWLEGGLAGLGLLATVLATLAAVVRRLIAGRAPPLAHAAWIGVAVLLAASMVDYPLRTPALMTLGAFLAALAVAFVRSADRPAATPGVTADRRGPA